MASKWYDLPLINAHEISLMALVYLILGTLMRSRCLSRLQLKLTNTTVLLSTMGSMYSAVLLNTFMLLTTFLGEDYRFLQPTAKINYYYLMRFLLQERQLSPKLLTIRVESKRHYLSFSGSGAITTLKLPSL